MTKKELENLIKLRREIKLLEDELQNLPVVSDSVRGSMPGFPYIEVVVPISGVDEGTGIRQKLEEKIEKLKLEISAVDEWIDTIQDAEMRMIMRMRYRNGMTQEAIATCLGYDRSSVSKKIKKYLNEL